MTKGSKMMQVIHINSKGTKRKQNLSLTAQIIKASLEFPSCDHALAVFWQSSLFPREPFPSMKARCTKKIQKQDSYQCNMKSTIPYIKHNLAPIKEARVRCTVCIPVLFNYLVVHLEWGLRPTHLLHPSSPPTRAVQPLQLTHKGAVNHARHGSFRGSVYTLSHDFIKYRYL